jgi:hypothetical protein
LPLPEHLGEAPLYQPEVRVKKAFPPKKKVWNGKK